MSIDTHKQAASTSMATLVQSGTTSSHCSLSSSHNLWFFDSRATKHMNGLSTSLLYHPITSSKCIILANVFRTSVASLDNVHLSPNIDLLVVFHVPSFPFSSLSKSKIITSLQCSVTFYHSLCVFQDLKAKKLIGMGYEVDGLYYLDLSPSLPLEISSISPMQWHCRLRHSSLSTLKRKVVSHRNVSSLKCETCRLSKHHRMSFPLRTISHVTYVFELVHYDF